MKSTISTPKYFLSALLFTMFLCVQNADAQTTVDRNVTVERDFQPLIQDAGKITSVPEILNIPITKERVEYSDFLTTLPFDKNFKPLSVVEIVHTRREVSTDAIVRLGFGNYWNTMGQVALPLMKNQNSRLDLMFDHLGTFGEKKHSNTQLALNFNQLFPKYDLYAGMDLSHEFFNYYGEEYDARGNFMDIEQFSSLLSIPSPNYKEQRLERITRTPQTVRLTDLASQPLTDALWRFNAHAGVRSLPGVMDHKYSGEINYDLFNSANGLQENIITAGYGFDTELGNNRFGFNFELTNFFYRKNNLPAINFWDYYAIFSMNPYYLIESTDWYIRAGMKTTFSFIHGSPFNPMPDFSAELKVLPGVLSVYGGLTGDFSISTLSRMYAENPYIFPDLRVKDTYTPVNVYIGFKVKAMHNLLIDAFLDYRSIKDQYFFVNKGYKSTDIVGDSASLFINRFNVVYSDASLVRFGVRANYNYRNSFNLQLKGVYNGWSVATEQSAWMKPAFEADISADWRITRHISTSAKLFFEGARFAQLGDHTARMQPKTDMNLAASYTFNRTFSTFLKLNNLFNNKYQEFYGYEVQGLNFLIGGALSF